MKNSKNLKIINLTNSFENTSPFNKINSKGISNSYLSLKSRNLIKIINNSDSSIKKKNMIIRNNNNIKNKKDNFYSFQKLELNNKENPQLVFPVIRKFEADIKDLLKNQDKKKPINQITLKIKNTKNEKKEIIPIILSPQSSLLPVINNNKSPLISPVQYQRKKIKTKTLTDYVRSLPSLKKSNDKPVLKLSSIADTDEAGFEQFISNSNVQEILGEDLKSIEEDEFIDEKKELNEEIKAFEVEKPPLKFERHLKGKSVTLNPMKRIFMTNIVSGEAKLEFKFNKSKTILKKDLMSG